MLARLKDMFAGLADRPDQDQEARWPDETQAAAAALLAEAARMDDSFDGRERAAIERLLSVRFDLAEDEAHALLAWADGRVAESTQILPFTRVVKDSFDYEERVELMEMLWSVAYADGRVHDYEASLLRRIAGLIYVSDSDSGGARKRARASAAAGPDEAKDEAGDEAGDET